MSSGCRVTRPSSSPRREVSVDLDDEVDRVARHVA